MKTRKLRDDGTTKTEMRRKEEAGDIEMMRMMTEGEGMTGVGEMTEEGMMTEGMIEEGMTEEMTEGEGMMNEENQENQGWFFLYFFFIFYFFIVFQW